MENTLIGWTDHTLNFWWGCTKVSPACTHCYAETVAKVFGKRLFGQVPQWGAGNLLDGCKHEAFPAPGTQN